MQEKLEKVQVILFEIDCTIVYTNLHELFCQFISWKNWVNSGRFMDNCWILCQVMADTEKIYDDLIIINLYLNNFPYTCINIKKCLQCLADSNPVFFMKEVFLERVVSSFFSIARTVVVSRLCRFC